MFFNHSLRKYYGHNTGFPGGSVVKNPPVNAGDMRQIPLSQKDPLEKELATHSSILAWKSHGQKSLVGYSSWGCKRVGHDLATKTTDIINTKCFYNLLL